MFKFFDKTNSTVNLILSLIAFSTIIVGGATGYQSVLDNVDENKKQIEITQIMILKDLVKKSEKESCIKSDVEWDEYIYNYSKLYDLKKDHKMISESTPWKPIGRNIECD